MFGNVVWFLIGCIVGITFITVVCLAINDRSDDDIM